MNILDSLFTKYGTDKSSKGHNFAGVYHEALHAIRHKAKAILEIGIFGTTPENAGASLKAWAEYFPNAHIYGVDLFDYSFLNSGRITTIVADQGIISDLEGIIVTTGSSLDLIIDDGSHLMHHQQIAFGYLFRHLRPGGYYIIEDLHTAYHDISNPTDTQYNTVLMLEVLRHTGTVLSDYISESDKQYVQQQLDFCELHKVTPFASETAVLRKRPA
jgi:demethylmacrocin O-methyltransferase